MELACAHIARIDTFEVVFLDEPTIVEFARGGAEAATMISA